MAFDVKLVSADFDGLRGHRFRFAFFATASLEPFGEFSVFVAPTIPEGDWVDAAWREAAQVLAIASQQLATSPRLTR